MSTTTESKTTSDQSLRNRLYSEAERTLRERHKDEFVSVIEELFAAHGLTYNRRLTEQERAEREIRERIAKYPALAEKFGAQATPQG